MNSMGKILGVLIVLAVLAVGGYLLFGRKGDTVPRQACATKSPQPKVVAFGDSLVEGYGASVEGGFVTFLSQESGIPITNQGESGDTTAQAKARLDSVIAMKPDITLVLLGGNDALQKVPQAQTEQNIGDIISALQQNGSKVILLGVLGGFPSDPYSSMFSRLAKKYSVTYVPNVLSGIIGHSSLMSDEVHPNQAGYQKIADKVLPALEKECGSVQ